MPIARLQRQRIPRTLERGRFHAGWKKLALADGHAKCAYVDWFPAFWGEVFWSLFRVYLAHRPRANHPFLFVSEHRHHRGEPYTVDFRPILSRDFHLNLSHP